jgi:hypothetical protein
MKKMAFSDQKCGPGQLCLRKWVLLPLPEGFSVTNQSTERAEVGKERIHMALPCSIKKTDLLINYFINV